MQDSGGGCVEGEEEEAAVTREVSTRARNGKTWGRAATASLAAFTPPAAHKDRGTTSLRHLLQRMTQHILARCAARGSSLLNPSCRLRLLCNAGQLAPNMLTRAHASEALVASVRQARHDAQTPPRALFAPAAAPRALAVNKNNRSLQAWRSGLRRASAAAAAAAAPQAESSAPPPPAGAAAATTHFTSLLIQDFALVREERLQLDPGLTVITGMLLHALRALSMLPMPLCAGWHGTPLSPRETGSSSLQFHRQASLVPARACWSRHSARFWALQPLKRPSARLPPLRCWKQQLRWRLQTSCCCGACWARWACHSVRLVTWPPSQSAASLPRVGGVGRSAGVAGGLAAKSAHPPACLPAA